jgi:hypothetical protein
MMGNASNSGNKKDFCLNGKDQNHLVGMSPIYSLQKSIFSALINGLVPLSYRIGSRTALRDLPSPVYDGVGSDFPPQNLAQLYRLKK